MTCPCVGTLLGNVFQNMKLRKQWSSTQEYACSNINLEEVLILPHFTMKECLVAICISTKEISNHFYFQKWPLRWRLEKQKDFAMGPYHTLLQPCLSGFVCILSVCNKHVKKFFQFYIQIPVFFLKLHCGYVASQLICKQCLIEFFLLLCIFKYFED